MSSKRAWVILNGKIVDREEAVVPAVSSGLYYGAGCFETMLAEEGNIFRLIEHVNRLRAGLNYLGCTEKELPKYSELRRDIQSVLQKNSLTRSLAKVRVQASFMTPGGYRDKTPADLALLITADPIRHEKKPLNLISAKTRVTPSSCKPAHFKLSNMLHYRQAAREAYEYGSDDAVMLTIDNKVAETSIANLFWKTGNSIYTPSESCDILPGITRNAIIELVREDTDFRMEEGKYDLKEIYEADLVWMTNSVKGIVPVSGIDGHSFETKHSFYKGLKDLFESLKRREG